MEFVLFGITGILSLLATLFWIGMIIDCAIHEPSVGNEKLIWIIIIVFTHFIGALIYYVVRRPVRMHTHGN